jgi:hypothetical protein
MVALSLNLRWFQYWPLETGTHSWGSMHSSVCTSFFQLGWPRRTGPNATKTLTLSKDSTCVWSSMCVSYRTYVNGIHVCHEVCLCPEIHTCYVEHLCHETCYGACSYYKACMCPRTHVYHEVHLGSKTCFIWYVWVMRHTCILEMGVTKHVCAMSMCAWWRQYSALMHAWILPQLYMSLNSLRTSLL